MAFSMVTGVSSTTVGYSGGTAQNPSYEDVCSGKTGHAEVVKVEFDATKVTYEELLKVFWETHDPTTMNRQGPDIGTQYRSVILYHDSLQEKAAREAVAELEASGKYKNPVVTSIEAASEFYPAEEYHQRYLEKRGEKSCRIKPEP
jgi:peptide-methionine (S)-S-oxide reductase